MTTGFILGAATGVVATSAIYGHPVTDIPKYAKKAFKKKHHNRHHHKHHDKKGNNIQIINENADLNVMDNKKGD